MGKNVKITPRARKIAEERNIDVSSIDIRGTAFRGGIGEKDILAFIDSGIPAVPKIRITPLAARIAALNGVDVSSISGSGAGGKTVKADVLAALALQTAPKAAEKEARPAGAADAGGPKMNGTKKIAASVPYAGVRKIIGERLAESKFTAPHLYFTQKIDLTELLALRGKVNRSQDAKISVTDCIARACVISLLKYPDLNASLVGGVIETYANVNIGVAVATDSGLIVPVVRDAQDLNLVGMSKAAAKLVNKAREGKLMPDEYTGGTFTVSNLGMFGIENFTAIINPPESGILAISSTKDEAVVTVDGNGEKSIAIRPIMNITLSVDHRLIDGLLAARFVAEVKRLLENPIELLI
jgi:pyruvate dehydrogenase E2 component (dihydrolipoamide acetyltransferase)